MGKKFEASELGSQDHNPTADVLTAPVPPLEHRRSVLAWKQHLEKSLWGAKVSGGEDGLKLYLRAFMEEAKLFVEAHPDQTLNIAATLLDIEDWPGGSRSCTVFDLDLVTREVKIRLMPTLGQNPKASEDRAYNLS